MKRLTKFIALFLAFALAFSLFACAKKEGEQPSGEEDPVPPAEEELGPEEPEPEPEPEPGLTVAYPTSPDYGAGVSVHDPSVFYDEASQLYYVFGSHFAVASSPDLIHWTQRSGDYAPQNLYGSASWKTVLSESVAYVGEGAESTWAPDVNFYDGKYYMYYSLSLFGGNRSVIGRVSAESVMGPYTNEEIFIRTDGSRTGPNAIDPELFYDKDGGLWMVYGSFFAGIYIKELYSSGEDWGRPKEDGIGKLVWKGGGDGPEGPFAFYNAETDYYYLMVSYGSLSTDYNMRVARSRTPDGPYLDIAGRDVSSAGGGNKLAGNYQFEGDTTGFAALGHNSVIERDGEYFCVYHTRYREGTSGVTGRHNVQVNQIYFNKEGWCVLSPDRYAGEHAQALNTELVAGNYDIVVHTAGTTQTFAESARYTLEADGTISGVLANEGTWSLSGENFITLTLGGVAYSGVVAPAWCLYRNRGVLAFTATSAAGSALWANGGAAAPQKFTSSVAVRAGAFGSIADKKIAAFDAAQGFSVSFTGSNVTSDWHSPVITAGAFGVHLPNLDSWTAGGKLNATNRYPAAEHGNFTEANPANPYVFCGVSCFITITVTSEGVWYYKDGVLVISYKAADPMRYNNAEDSATVTVGDFLAALLAEISQNGFTFATTADSAGRVSATDFFLTDALTAEQAVSLKRDYEAYRA